jgi:hypothetical protein
LARTFTSTGLGITYLIPIFIAYSLTSLLAHAVTATIGHSNFVLALPNM